MQSSTNLYTEHHLYSVGNIVRLPRDFRSTYKDKSNNAMLDVILSTNVKQQIHITLYLLNRQIL